MRSVDFVVRTLIHWYPAPFRQRFAREIEESTRLVIRRAWARGAIAGVLTTMRAVLDLVCTVWVERRRAATPGGSRFGAGFEVRDAFRQLRRNPGFTAAAVLTLSLALGGVTAVFAVADPFLFRPLPYAHADRIVKIISRSEAGSYPVFAADFLQMLEHKQAFEWIGEFDSLAHIGRLREEDPGHATVLIGGATPEALQTFGVRPIIGRTFRPKEYPDAPVALITYGFWQQEFGGRSDIVGQQFRLVGARPKIFEIVGVLPRDFVLPDFNNKPPIAIVPTDVDRKAALRPNYVAVPFGLLKPGVSIQQAATEVQRALDEVQRSSPAFGRGPRQAVVVPLRDALFRQVRRPLLMLLSIAALVALLAAANLAHLFLARGVGRARELATRQALGASRARLVRLLVIEAAMIAAAGWAGAMMLGRSLRDAILAVLPETVHVYRSAYTPLDGRVMAAIALCAAAALIIFGVLPALLAVRANLRGAMADGQGARHRVSRHMLVLAQTGTAVAVVLTALLLAATFTRLASQSLGYEPRGVTAVSMLTSGPFQQDTEAFRRVNLEMRRQIEAVVGRPVAMANGMPGQTWPIGLGRPDQETRAYPTVGYPVSAEFFDVFQIRPVRGRLMTREESITAAPVVVIDERAAHLAWPGQDPIGRELRDTEGTVRTVIGVVGALQTHLFSERFQDATAFVPLWAPQRRFVTWYWRGESTPAQRLAIRQAAASLVPRSTADIEPLRLFKRQLDQPRFLATLLGALAALAIALTVVGLYGVVSHGVAQRTREMGIRIALGAETMGIARLIVLQALRPAALGVALGLAASLWWTETLRAMLHGVSPHDWRVFAAAGILVLLLVAVACLLPVRRATRVDPLIALKAE
ncbi:MAG TPA: ABC transporter permease [Vicinamibacterales bacterium]